MARDKEPLTPREARNRNILILCMVLGGVIAAALIVGSNMMGEATDAHWDSLGAFSGPLPPLLAIALAGVWGIVLPIISLLWLRVIDEHERSAYRDGAEAAAFAYLTGAPIWWILWRGGLVPVPDGVVIFVAFNFIYLAVWLWRKYH
ncbi:MAG: hypothetical protein ABL882_12260 [Sphingopyxis sp.]